LDDAAGECDGENCDDDDEIDDCVDKGDSGGVADDDDDEKGYDVTGEKDGR